MRTLRKLIISLDDSPDYDLSIIERVAELVKQGYTSGYSPDWDIVTE